MARAAAPIAVAILLALLAGCFGEGGPPRSGDSTSTSPATSGATGVHLSGEVRRLSGGYAANLTARNDGPDAIVRYQGCGNSWTATLSGPPGDGLPYRRPGGTTLSCPALPRSLPPGGNDTWSFAPDSPDDCRTAFLCDNVWDGNLSADDGRRAPAPRGRYAWTFTFHWTVQHPDGTARPHSASIALPVDVGPEGIEVSGSLLRVGASYAANVTATNHGPQTYSYGVSYCIGGYGAWSATLSGPPGDGLDYDDPSRHSLGCAGHSSTPMAPGMSSAWSFEGDPQTGKCPYSGVCDNVWDGNLTLDGTRGPAPPGTYTWTFTFAYGAPDGVRRESLAFTLQVPWREA